MYNGSPIGEGVQALLSDMEVMIELEVQACRADSTEEILYILTGKGGEEMNL